MTEQSTVSRQLTLDSRDEAVLLFGSRDQFLKLIRDALGVRLIARGDTLQIDGPEEAVGITERAFEIFAYPELINKEAEIIGVSDHLATELPDLLRFVREKSLDLTSVVTRRLPLEAEAVNGALDHLEQFGDQIRTVIVHHLLALLPIARLHHLVAEVFEHGPNAVA